MGKALGRALALLARRAYTEAELRRKLAGYPEAEVEEALGRLRGWGYLDDRAYAEAFVRSRRHRFGPHRLRRELLRRGVDEGIVEAVLGEEEGEVDRAVRLLARRWDRYRDRRERAVRFLLGRGFSLEAALQAYRRLQEGGDEG